MINGRHLPLVALCLFGAGWGLTQPLAKIAVSGEFRAFGMILWQLVIAVLVLGPLTLLRGRRLSFGRGDVALYALIAVLGTLLPNAASYTAARFLPSGIMSIIISMVPMLAFPMALALGLDRFSAARLVGLSLGLAGVALIALPGSSLPERGMVVFLPLAMIAPVCYAMEGNLVARIGTGALDAVQVLLGAALVGLLPALALAVGTGQLIWPGALWHGGLPAVALLGASFLNAVIYAGYVWLIGRAGSVFATQIAYLVTGTGVVWAMVLLDERYSGWVWAALGLMLAGLTLVRPRQQALLVPPLASPR